MNENVTTVTKEQVVNPNLQVTKLLELPNNYGERLSPAMYQQVQSLASSININSRDYVTNYGAEQQSTLGKFADTMLAGHTSKEMGEAGDLLNEAMNYINGYDADLADEKKGFFGKFFSNQKRKIQQIQDSYKSVDKKIEVIVQSLVAKKQAISKVYDEFDSLYESNKESYMNLTAIIYAGELAKKEAEEKLKLMQNDPDADPQDIRDFSDNINRFDKRLNDLKLTRAIAISIAPQIRATQNSALQIEDTINTSINTSIPLWKTQMAIAIGIRTIQTGLDATNQVNDINNRMLLTVSEAGKNLIIESAKANQRGIIDIETVRQLNQNLIEALTESTRITNEGIETRRKNEQELQQLETSLVTTIKKIY